MAAYSRQEVTHIRVEFVVPAADPWGACWVEVQKAIAAATDELHETGRLNTLVPSDDAIRIRPTDDAVVVFYEFEVPQ